MEKKEEEEGVVKGKESKAKREGRYEEVKRRRMERGVATEKTIAGRLDSVTGGAAGGG